MTFEPNPYSSPQTLADDHGRDTIGSRRSSRLPSAGLGSAIGLGVSVLWTTVIGPLIFRAPPPIGLSVLIGSGFVVTGFTVGAIQRLSPVFGAAIGLLTLSTLAIITGLKDTWIVVRLIVFGGSGLFGGFAIGCLFFLVHKRKKA